MVSKSTRSNTNAADIELRGVRRELRFFIEQYRKGQRETTKLVLLESLHIQNRVKLEAGRTNKAVGVVGQKVDSLAALADTQRSERVRERFLESLKYPEFNQRRNQIEAADGDTLKWIFVVDNAEESKESSGEALGFTNSEEEEKRDRRPREEIKWHSFSKWLSSTDTIYWISGKPGLGKTTVVKNILADKRTK